MTKLIFSDASFDPVAKSGIAGFLLLNDDLKPDSLSLYHEQISVKRFHDTTNTALEIEAVLWALDAVEEHDAAGLFKIYTDCKTVVDLPARRPRLEARNFKSRKSGSDLSNADLYRKIYSYMDRLNLEFIHVKGHKPRGEMDLIDQVFSLVDKHVRQTMRVGKSQK